jgi:riboflavin synthase
MFTGLIETVGELAEIRPIDAGFRLRVLTGIAADLHVGDSVAVNGVCLTIVDSSRTDWSAEVGPETAKVTSLGSLRPGSLINLERAMPADGRFGGHIVLGHIDGVGAIQSIRPESDFYWVTVSCPGGLTPYVIHRGSIAVDGISLTVAGLSSSTFDVQIVPFTWAHTNLHGARVGDRVNLECDMVGKYVVRAVELYLEQHVVSGFGRTVGKA